MKTIKIKKKILLWITVFLGLGGVISGLLTIMWGWDNELAVWFLVFFFLFFFWFMLCNILVVANDKGKVTFT